MLLEWKINCSYLIIQINLLSLKKTRQMLRELEWAHVTPFCHKRQHINLVLSKTVDRYVPYRPPTRSNNIEWSQDVTSAVLLAPNSQRKIRSWVGLRFLIVAVEGRTNVCISEIRKEKVFTFAIVCLPVSRRRCSCFQYKTNGDQVTVRRQQLIVSLRVALPEEI